MLLNLQARFQKRLRNVKQCQMVGQHPPNSRHHDSGPRQPALDSVPISAVSFSGTPSDTQGELLLPLPNFSPCSWLCWPKTHRQAPTLLAVFAAGSILSSSNNGARALVSTSPPSWNTPCSLDLRTSQSSSIASWHELFPTIISAQGLKPLFATIKSCSCARPRRCRGPTHHPPDYGNCPVPGCCHPLQHQVRCLHPRFRSLHPLQSLWSCVVRPSRLPNKTETQIFKEEPAAPGQGDGTAILQQGPLEIGAVGPLQSSDSLMPNLALKYDLSSGHRSAPLRYDDRCLGMHLLQLLEWSNLPAFNAG